jgi:hypothetical protein
MRNLTLAISALTLTLSSFGCGAAQRSSYPSDSSVYRAPLEEPAAKETYSELLDALTPEEREALSVLSEGEYQMSEYPDLITFSSNTHVATSPAYKRYHAKNGYVDQRGVYQGAATSHYSKSNDREVGRVFIQDRTIYICAPNTVDCDINQYVDIVVLREYPVKMSIDHLITGIVQASSQLRMHKLTETQFYALRALVDTIDTARVNPAAIGITNCERTPNDWNVPVYGRDRQTYDGIIAAISRSSGNRVKDGLLYLNYQDVVRARDTLINYVLARNDCFAKGSSEETESVQAGWLLMTKIRTAIKKTKE